MQYSLMKDPAGSYSTDTERGNFSIAPNIFLLALLVFSVGANLLGAQYTCGTLDSPGGKCQYGTCQPLTKCESAASCPYACAAAGVTSCFVCVSPIDVAMCNIKNQILAVSGVLALLLMSLGGLVYLFGNMLPNPVKANAHSYGLAMIVGGIVSLVIFSFAGPIVGLVTGAGNLYLISC